MSDKGKDFHWSSITSNIIVSSGEQINQLQNLQNILLQLRKQFGQSGIQFSSKQHQNIDKRIMLLEHQVEGLMKRNLNVRDGNNQRYLDYSLLLNEKQNQIIQLEKKIQNLEERLRKLTARQIQLQNYTVKLTGELHFKEQIIESKNRVLQEEVSVSNELRKAVSQIKKNIDFNKGKLGELEKLLFSGVKLPDLGSFQIRSQVLSGLGKTSNSENDKNKMKLLQMFRQFQRLLKQPEGITNQEIDKIIEAFLISKDGTVLYQRIKNATKRNNIEQNYQRLKDNMVLAARIYQNNLQTLKRDNPGVKINLDRNLFEILQLQKVKAYQATNGVVYVDCYSEKTVQIPIQDARTKHLLHLFATQLKKIMLKYPKLQNQMDVHLRQFLTEQIIECIEVDEIDRLVEIIKYVPQVVKVQNVYASSNQKSRKIQFHLRVLIKALLQELEKIKKKSGLVLQLDEGVVGMIKEEIMDVVDIDHILKVFKVVPKIVQVQKIVEKIVEKLVEVPKVITIQKVVEKIIQVQKIVEIEKMVNVPIEIPFVVCNQIEKIVPLKNTIEKIVEVPVVIEKIIEMKKQLPTVIEVQKFQDRVVQVEKIIEVQKVVNHIQKQPQRVEVINEKIVTVEKIVERIVQVPVIVEKIVEKVIQVPQVIQIQKIIQKIVPQIQYRNARQIQNHIEVQHMVVDRIIEKPIPIIQTIQKIREVPQVVEKIIAVEKIVKQIQEVEVIREKIVVQQKIKEVQKVTVQIVQKVKEIIKQVEKIVKVPYIHQIPVKIIEFIEKPIIQRVQNTVIKEVYLRDPLVIKQPRIVDVQLVVNHYIEVPKPIKYIQEKIVQVPRVIDRIKQVRVQIDKVIEKMVEVPKVVEVEKIVQKIVVVPRVIEKVVEVPKIVEKAVQKEVVRQVIHEIEKIVQMPVIREKIVEVQKIKNIFIQVEKIVQKEVDKLVEVSKYEEKVINNTVVQERVVELLKQVPIKCEIEKIVPQSIEHIHIIEVQKPLIVPVQIAVPVQQIVQKVVLQKQVIEKIVQVPQIVQKVVTTCQQVVKIQQVEQIVQKVVVNQRIREIQKLVPYYQEVIKEVPTIVQKIVPILSTVQQVVTAEHILQKIVQKTVTVPKIYQVEKLKQILVQVPKFIEIQQIVPQIVHVNKYIQNIVEKIVEVPMIIEKVQQIVRENQKVVGIATQTQKVVEVERIVEKVVLMDKIKQVVRNVNHIEKVLQIVDRIQQIPYEVMVTEEKLIEIPVILQKIVQKIVVMPQIVEVLKYVHQMCQSNDPGCCVSTDIGIHENQFKMLSRNINISLNSLLSDLKGLKSVKNQYSEKIQSIEVFLQKLQQFILVPRLIKVHEEKIIQKQVVVEKMIKIPTQDERSLRMQLSLSILVEKLIMQVKRIQNKTSIKLELDEDIKLIFFADLQSTQKINNLDLQKKMNQYCQQIHKHFTNLGNWSLDHQLMLNSFLQERFFMAELIQNANIQIQRSQISLEKRKQQFFHLQRSLNIVQGFMNEICFFIGNCDQKLIQQLSTLQKIVYKYESFNQGIPAPQTRVLAELSLNDQRFQSRLRQKEEEIIRLHDKIRQIQIKNRHQITRKNDTEILNALRVQNDRMKDELGNLRQKVSQDGIVTSYRRQIQGLKHQNFQLEGEISNLRGQVFNLSKQLNLIKSQQSGKDENPFLKRGIDQKIQLGDRTELSSRAENQSYRSGTTGGVGQQSGRGQYLTSQFPEQVDEGLKGSSYRANQSGNTQFRTDLHTQLRTPIQALKFSSPSTTGIKMTDSGVHRDLSSFSGVSAESPSRQYPSIPRSYHDYSSSEKKQQKK